MAAGGGAAAGAAGGVGSGWPQPATSPHARTNAPNFSMDELPRLLFSATLAQGTGRPGRRLLHAIRPNPQDLLVASVVVQSHRPAAMESTPDLQTELFEPVRGRRARRHRDIREMWQLDMLHAEFTQAG